MCRATAVTAAAAAVVVVRECLSSRPVAPHRHSVFVCSLPPRASGPPAAGRLPARRREPSARPPPGAAGLLWRSVAEGGGGGVVVTSPQAAAVRRQTRGCRRGDHRYAPRRRRWFAAEQRARGDTSRAAERYRGTEQQFALGGQCLRLNSGSLYYVDRISACNFSDCQSQRQEHILQSSL